MSGPKVGNGVISALCRLAGVKVIRLKQEHLPSSFDQGPLLGLGEGVSGVHHVGILKGFFPFDGAP
jgi:hypothetical protein